MYWQENAAERKFVVPDDVVDVVYSIVCRSLPVEHAYALFDAIQRALPWLTQEPSAGVHPLHVADSGNGWMRPDRPSDLLHLSRRTKLILRVPKARIEDAKRLSGHTLDVAGNAMEVETPTVRPLSALTTIFSRYVVAAKIEDENAFLGEALGQLKAMNIHPAKMLCGMEKSIDTPAEIIRTRSLMLADLTVEESVRLQQQGLGPMRHLGCGLFIPHKDINEVGQARR